MQNRLAEVYREYHRLQGININSFTERIKTHARQFMKNVFNGDRGNSAAMLRAIHALPNVKRIGGGNMSRHAHVAATKIQARVRGMKNRKSLVLARNSRFVHMPNNKNNMMVAIPTILQTLKYK